MTDMDEFQNRVARWCAECFGKTTAYDVTERNWRFLEEAIELVQSLGGTADDAHRLVDYVFAREPGEPLQEVGGTMVTLAALVAANGLSMSDGAMREVERIERPDVMDRIRAKHASKPHRSPLPGDYRHPEAANMTEQLYRIKTLEWSVGNRHATDQHAFIPGYTHRHYSVFQMNSGWYWESPDGIHDREPYASARAAKEAAEQHYSERLMEALEPEPRN